MRVRGYALIESLLASVILATGLLLAVSVFCVSARASWHNRQRAVATMLARDKMEELRQSAAAGRLMIGGGLDPLHPISGFHEFIPPFHATHLRLWEIRGTGFQTVTVAVFELSGTTKPVELDRLSSGW